MRRGSRADLDENIIHWIGCELSTTTRREITQPHTHVRAGGRLQQQQQRRQEDRSGSLRND